MCCYNEGAIQGPEGDRGPACFTNHRWRICQSLELQLDGLAFSSGPIQPSPDSHVEIIDVACGQTVTLNLYNNTCDNETEVTLNGTIPRINYGITCTAGGSINKSGKVPHYNIPSRTHFKAQTITYTAPATLPSCFTTPRDIITAEAGGGVRDIIIRVSCGTTGDEVAGVELSPPPGTFSGPVDVGMTTSTPGASIHYTTDGSEPTVSSPSLPNGGTVTVDRTTTIRARAFRGGYTPSGITGGTYTITLPQVGSLQFVPPGGSYPAALDVVILTTTQGATIHYTTDGSEPTESSPTTLPIHVDKTTTIRARAYAPGHNPSDIAAATYTIVAPSCNASGIFSVSFTVQSDGGGHHPFIALVEALLTLGVNGGNVSLSGNQVHTLAGSGSLDTNSCSFVITTTGVVAGISGVECRYEVSIEGNTITGTYTLGTNGALPGGMPIVYSFEGTRQ